MSMTKTLTSTEAARRAMIDSQLRTSGVNEPFVLARMAAVPREDFVPAAARDTAYIDRAIPLENGRRLAAPLFYGMMLAEAQPLAAETALVVDSGSGYLPELLRPLVKSVDVITPEEALVKSRKAAVYSLMLVDGAVEELPDSLTKRLGDGGRVLTGLVTKGVTRLAVGRKTAGGVALLPLAELGIPRLSEFDKAAGWSF
ncbi:protein-L-isoaspartate O-methyltransferase family protein [Allopontixanthobacter sediminis]|nr:protein-L-isoaspartate O-methyltransferase [Allopontixanthobacter sediminis]